MKLRNLLPKQWGAMTLYQRFESLAAMATTLLVSLVIVVAIVRLAAVIGSGLVLGALNPLDYVVFQSVFGEIITVLIALEFNHSLQYVVTAQKSRIQTKAILLIALLAVARKFLILDIQETSGATRLGLAAMAPALGIVYWLLREGDDRSAPIALRRPESTDET